MRRMVAARLAGAMLVSALIVIGLAMATRPIGDERMWANAARQGGGRIVSTGATWDGAELLTVAWQAGGRQLQTQFEFPFGSPYSVGDSVTLRYDPQHPAADVVFTDYYYYNFNDDFRADAALQSVVPLTLAVLALALLVIWPTRASQVFAPDSISRARASMRRYLLTPAAISAALVAAPVIVMDQHLADYSLGADVMAGWLSVLPLFVLIWLPIRAARFARLRRRLTLVDDPVDGAAVIAAVAGRRLRMDTRLINASDGEITDGRRATVRLVALKGQRTESFQPGDCVRLYGRWDYRGTALITDGQAVVVGIGRRRTFAERIADPLGRQHPELRRKLRWYLTLQLTLIVLVSGGSIAIVASAQLNPGWLWLPGCLVYGWMVFVLIHGAELHRLLRGSYDARHGVVRSVILSRKRGRIMALIDVPEQRKREWRAIGERQPDWLSEGQEVVILQLSRNSNTAVLATSDGRAVLARARLNENRTSRLAAEP